MLAKKTRNQKDKYENLRLLLFLSPLIFILLSKIDLPFPSRIPPVQSSRAETREIAVKKQVFGYSQKNRPIEGYVIGEGKRVIFLMAAIHGNEMGTSDLLARLVTEIKKDPALISLENKLIIVPIVNPDGYYDRIDKLNANGVNLNLNFETTDWKNFGGEAGTYGGPYPFSEIESRVIKEIVEKTGPSLMISFHSLGSLVTPENNHSDSINLAKWYATQTGYQYFDDEIWNYTGTATKWFVETTECPAITVELSSHNSNDWEINKKALLTLIGS